MFAKTASVLTFALFIVAGLCLAPAHSFLHRKNVSAGPPPAGALVANNCAVPDMVINSADAVQAISDCHIGSGPNAMFFVLATAEITCQSPSDIMMYLVAGNDAFPDPPTGANFVGSISAGVLTVTSMITPYPEYSLTTGLTLFDAGNGAAGTIPSGTRGNTIKINSFGTGTGGTGTYNVSDLTSTVSSETMWAAPIVGGPQSNPPHGAWIVRDPIEQIGCQSGKTYIATMSGQFVGTPPAGSNRTWWVKMMMTTEKLGGLATKAASYRNGQFSMISPQ